MTFVSYGNGTVTVEFSKKTMMHLRLLERKKTEMEAALSDAFGEPIALQMRLEGERSAPAATTTAAAKRVIEQSYDIFGRENIDLL